MKKIIIWLSKQILHYSYILLTNLPSMKKKIATEGILARDNKKIRNFNFPSDAIVLSLCDYHFGTGYSHPEYIKLITDKAKPNVIVIIGDSFESHTPITFSKILTKKEKSAIAFLNNWSRMKGNRLIILSGDHDSWLAENNPFRVAIYEKVILNIGGKKFLFTHGDEYDAAKKENGKILDNYISPVYHWFRGHRAEDKNGISAELLEWCSKTAHFITVIKKSRKIAMRDARNNNCSTVLVGHFHFKHRYRKFLNKKWTSYIMIEGGEVEPRRYVIITKKKAWVRIYRKKIKS